MPIWLKILDGATIEFFSVRAVDEAGTRQLLRLNYTIILYHTVSYTA